MDASGQVRENVQASLPAGQGTSYNRTRYDGEDQERVK